jgi:hypothetical protein
MTFLRHVLFGLSEVSLQRYDSANFGLILKKRRICPVLRLFIYSIVIRYWIYENLILLLSHQQNYLLNKLFFLLTEFT